MKLPVYLYANLFEVILDLDNNNRINQVMYQRDLKLQKGVKNKVQIQFKNSDQKFIDVSTSSFVFVLFDTVNQRNLIEKDVTILDDGTTRALRGLGEVVFTESDLQACESTYYKMGVKAVDKDGSYTPTFANTYYGVGATIEVRHDLYPTLVPSQETTKFSTYYNADQNAMQYEYYTGNLNAHPEFKGNAALHTAAIYMTRYKGRVIVEGTLESNPGSFGHYAIIKDTTYTGFTGIDYYNFNGVFSKIRVRYIPAKEPVSQQNNNTVYAGTVDKVLYRS
jgi:hypothetical protein